MKSKMDNNFIKLAKFEKLITDLSRKVDLTYWNYNYGYYMKLIYNYDELNYYGKIIFEKLRMDIDDKDESFGYFMVVIDGTFDNKIKAVESLVHQCNYEPNAHKFIFWALMILSVDKKDKDEKLSLICDLVSMMNVKECEVLDIINVIKLIYGENFSESDFKSNAIKETFKDVLKRYNINV